MWRVGLLVVLMVGVLAQAAEASRAPTSKEKAAIKRVALKKCNASAPAACRFHKARVSTKNARYAWADVTGEGFSGVLLTRANTRTRSFKVIATQGGGVEDCSKWRSKASSAVLKDLRIVGVRGGDDVGNC
jgi:curli biogenesis system outer membrane secretion channel CsgG